MAVPRPVLFAGRVVLWAALGLLLVRGIIDVARPEEKTQQVSSPVELDGALDTQSAEAFAVRFVSDYLSVDESEPEKRRTALASYLAEGVDTDGGWDGTGSQTVLETVPVSVETGSDGAAVVTVAARLDGGRWIHLEVPLAGDDSGYVVTGLPALVPATPEADGLDAGSFEDDPDLTGQLRSTVESFFAAYGDGSPDELDRWLVPGRHLAGLAGDFRLEAVDQLAATESENGTTLARATVRWIDTATAITFGSTYDLTLVHQDGRWYVERLAALGG